MMNTQIMSRTFYLFGIFFSCLFVLIGLFQSFTFLPVQDQLYMLPSLAGWIVFVTTLSLVAALILLKYYQYQKYWFAFSTGLLQTLASFCYSSLFYVQLQGVDVQNYFLISYFTILGTSILYAIGLIFSRAGKRFWLKIAGIYLFIIGIVLLCAMIGRMYAQGAETFELLIAVQQWAGIAVQLLPVLFILNFWGEIKELEQIKTPASLAHRSWNVSYIVICTSALVLAIMFGQNIFQESKKVLASSKEKARDEAWSARPYEARTFVGQKGDKLNYRLLKPLNYNSARKYPLVVHLHGGGGRGTDNVKQIYYGVFSTLLIGKSREDYPAFVFVPQCPPNATWGGAPYILSMEDLVFETISALEKEFSIDEKRRYIMGASMGGYGTWHFISVRPEIFAAAVPVCGGGDPMLIPNAVKVPIWAFHGMLDDLVPVSKSREMIEALKGAGGNPNYTEYPDKGHDLWAELSNTPELLEWMFSQRRD